MTDSEIIPASLSISITLFGPLQVRVDGVLLPPFRSRKHLWVVALLTLRHNQPVGREWLAGNTVARCGAEQRLAAARAALGDPAAFDFAWAEGRAMTPEQAISYALEEESVSPMAAI